MATFNPAQSWKGYVNQLKNMDQRLASGEAIPKVEFDNLIANLRHSGDMAVAYGAKIPILSNISGMTNSRINRLADRAEKDINNPKLYTIEGGVIRMIGASEQVGEGKK